MTKIELTEDLIAPCGMNCGICIAFLREKNPCHGCRQAHLNKAKTRIVCRIKNCENLKEVKGSFCYDCASFPCKQLKHLDTRYTSKYHMSMLENLKMIKNQGMNTFLDHQQKLWACPTCGSTICCHNGLCYQCQRDEVKARKNRLGWTTDAEKQEKKKESF